MYLYANEQAKTTSSYLLFVEFDEGGLVPASENNGKGTASYCAISDTYEMTVYITAGYYNSNKKIYLNDVDIMNKLNSATSDTTGDTLKWMKAINFNILTFKSTKNPSIFYLSMI